MTDKWDEKAGQLCARGYYRSQGEFADEVTAVAAALRAAYNEGVEAAAKLLDVEGKKEPDMKQIYLHPTPTAHLLDGQPGGVHKTHGKCLYSRPIHKRIPLMDGNIGIFDADGNCIRVEPPEGP